MAPVTRTRGRPPARRTVGAGTPARAAPTQDQLNPAPDVSAQLDRRTFNDLQDIANSDLRGGYPVL